MVTRTVNGSRPFRCYTRALKNARFLQQMAPQLFAKNPKAEGFGTGVPMEILRRLHRIRPDSPVLSRQKAVADFLRKNRLPVPARHVAGALFSGTVYFAQVTFQTSGSDLVVKTADMKQIVQYARHAIVPISEYAEQYGSNTVKVSPTLLTFTASAPPQGIYTDTDVQGWVDQMVSANSLPRASCIFVVSPQGVIIAGVGRNSGHHLKAKVPYAVAGVWDTGLTLADNLDVYAMAVSHELAEMIVDPDGDYTNPEVCDGCDLYCGNLTRSYFDASDNYLDSNHASPPGGLTFSYYICAVEKPAGAGDCPASSANCAYAP
jgi:hypothetical protein